MTSEPPFLISVTALASSSTPTQPTHPRTSTHPSSLVCSLDAWQPGWGSGLIELSKFPGISVRQGNVANHAALQPWSKQNTYSTKHRSKSPKPHRPSLSCPGLCHARWNRQPSGSWFHCRQVHLEGGTKINKLRYQLTGSWASTQGKRRSATTPPDAVHVIIDLVDAHCHCAFLSSMPNLPGQP